jgi:hypothetical protein
MTRSDFLATYANMWSVEYAISPPPYMRCLRAASLCCQPLQYAINPTAVSTLEQEGRGVLDIPSARSERVHRLVPREA